jgi:hypothetical protein
MDELPESVVKVNLASCDARVQQASLQSQRRKFAHGMGQDIDTDTKWLARLKDLAGYAALVKTQSKGQPAYSCTCDNDHGRLP